MTTPQTPDYGRDLKCGDDIDPYAKEVMGTRLVAERVFRRFITPRGTLVGAPNDGIDLRAELNDSLDLVRGIARLQGEINSEANKEEVGDTYDITVDYTASTNTLNVAIDGAGALGPFSLVLNVDAVTVALLAE
jgi:hypothetical protein